MKTPVTLKETIADAERTAQLAVADPHQGKSPFVAPLRSALSRAVELEAEHTRWLSQNPQPQA